MKYLLIFLFGFPAMAEWCDVKDKATGQVIDTYQGACRQGEFAGHWGDPKKTVHAANATKQKELDDASSDRATKSAAKQQRIQRLRTSCAVQTGLMKELCDHVLDN